MRRGEFNIWAYGLQALSSGKSSLDYRVRFRKDVQGVILALLGGLSQDLEDCIRIDRKPSSEGTGDVALSELHEESGEDFDFVDFSDDEAKSESHTSASENGLFSLQMYNIKTIIAQLTRFSSMIRRSGTKFRFERADSALPLRESEFDAFKEHLTNMILLRSIKFDVCDLENFDVFQDKTNPDILTPVQKRLIHGNVVRRNRIMEATKNMRSVKPQVKSVLKDPTHVRNFVVPEINAQAPTPVPQSKTAQSNMGGTVKSSAQSRVESIARSATEIGSQLGLQLAPPKAAPSVVTKVTKIGSNQDYPKCPNPISDNFIQCPYCADVLPKEYRNSSSRGHVAQDILPYMCIYEQCPLAEEMYLTSEELISHVHEHHARKMWACDFCLPNASETDLYVFESPIEWQKHVQQSHRDSVLVQQLPSLARFSERQVMQAMSCPLCAYIPVGIQSTVDQHILQHLHEFALRSLPSRDDPGTDGSISDDTVCGLSTNTDPTDPDEDLKMPKYPPGTLPPTGLSGQFLRRQREEDKAPPELTRALLQQELDECIEVMKLGIIWTTINPNDDDPKTEWVQDRVEPIRKRAAIFYKNYDRLRKQFPDRIERLRLMIQETTNYCPTNSTPNIGSVDVWWICRDWVRPLEIELEILNALPEENPTSNELPVQLRFDLDLPQKYSYHYLNYSEAEGILRKLTLVASRKQTIFLALLDDAKDSAFEAISEFVKFSDKHYGSRVYHVDLNDVQFGPVRKIGDLDRVFGQIATELLVMPDLLDILAPGARGSDLVEAILRVANGKANTRWIVIIDNLTIPVGDFLSDDTANGKYIHLPEMPAQGRVVIVSSEQLQLPEALEVHRISLPPNPWPYPYSRQPQVTADDTQDEAVNDSLEKIFERLRPKAREEKLKDSDPNQNDVAGSAAVPYNMTNESIHDLAASSILAWSSIGGHLQHEPDKKSRQTLTEENLRQVDDGTYGISTQSTRASRGGSRTRQPKTTRSSGSNSNDEDDTIKARSGVEVEYDGIKIKYDKGGKLTLGRSGGRSDRSDVPSDGPSSLVVSQRKRVPIQQSTTMARRRQFYSALPNITPDNDDCDYNDDF
ncbi:hypothetical protein E8E14_001436 [Neopestalotiopsis sp. 37M]|nr:hypothetical protein E8E14_001436 [Neopestalotiopsis sp. 37M]